MMDASCPQVSIFVRECNKIPVHYRCCSPTCMYVIVCNVHLLPYSSVARVVSGPKFPDFPTENVVTVFNTLSRITLELLGWLL
jgi:hypothetical protein